MIYIHAMQGLFDCFGGFLSRSRGFAQLYDCKRESQNRHGKVERAQ